MTRQPLKYRRAAAIVLTNLLAAVVIYLLFGWHFIRGYREVVNFVSVGLVNILAALNAAAAAVGWGWFITTGRWKEAPRAKTLTIGFAASAVLLFCSPLFVPAIGRFAKYHGFLRTPLVEAARYGDSRLVVVMLVRDGANPNVKHDALGTTPLHYMAARGSPEVVKLLLEKGADPNAQADYSLETPLHWAVKTPANLRTIEYLAQHGANPDLEDGDGESPLDYVSEMPESKAWAIFRVFRRGLRPRS